jgi:hypothetical protein
MMLPAIGSKSYEEMQSIVVTARVARPMELHAIAFDPQQSRRGKVRGMDLITSHRCAFDPVEKLGEIGVRVD